MRANNDAVQPMDIENYHEWGRYLPLIARFILLRQVDMIGALRDTLQEAKDMLSDNRELLRNQCRKDLHAQEGLRDRTETGRTLSVTEAEPTSTCSRAHVQDVQSREGIAACCFRLPRELALEQEIQSNIVGITTRLQQ